MAISVIIPTYKEPEHLEFCIKSALEHAVNSDNEIVVYVDGTVELEGNRKVIEIYKDRVKFLVAKENRGMCVGMNTAISFASKDYCLVVNDDMVFPKNWDIELERYGQSGWILLPNVMEPEQSCYPDVTVRFFGKDPGTFNLKGFLEESYRPGLEPFVQIGGDRLPFFISKYEYLSLGGWDTNCIHGLQADDDFFLKAKVLKFKTVIIPSITFYHFTKTSVNDTSLGKNGKVTRAEAFSRNYKYLNAKWGGAIPLNVGMSQICLVNPETNQIII